MESPLATDMLARCNIARQATMTEIDEFLQDSFYRESYSCREVRDILLDIRRKLDDVEPR